MVIGPRADPGVPSTRPWRCPVGGRGPRGGPERSTGRVACPSWVGADPAPRPTWPGEIAPGIGTREAPQPLEPWGKVRARVGPAYDSTRMAGNGRGKLRRERVACPVARLGRAVEMRLVGITAAVAL